MPEHVQQLGHGSAQSEAFVGRERQITIDTGRKTIRVHDGVTPGGILLAKDADLIAGLALKANIASPIFTGTPQAPTPDAATDNSQIPTTEWVKDRIDAESVSGISDVPGLQAALDLKASNSNVNAALGLKANIAGPTFTGNPRAPTPAEDDDSTRIATTAFVQTEIAGLSSGTPQNPATTISQVSGLQAALDAKAALAGAAFTGGVTVPNRTAGDNGANVANTAFVAAAIANFITSTDLAAALATGGSIMDAIQAAISGISVIEAAATGRITITLSAGRSPLLFDLATINITPPTATSKLLIMSNVTNAGAREAFSTRVQVTRNNSVLLGSRYDVTDTWDDEDSALTDTTPRTNWFIDSPATTDELTYKLQYLDNPDVVDSEAPNLGVTGSIYARVLK